MAVTQEQADTASVFHQENYRGCDDRRGPLRWRRNGVTQRWKRDTKRFRIPVKQGLYSTGQITNANQHQFHTGADCPVAPEGHN